MPPLLPDAWVSQVYQHANIVDVVSNYLPLRQQGRNHVGLCPFHNEKTPSFSVNPDNNVYHCFGCKAGGNVVQFVMEMEKLTYPEALRHLAKMYGLPPPPEQRNDPEEQQQRSRRERLMEANREAAQYFFDQLWQPHGREALNYLHKRGVDDSIIRRFGIGFSGEGWQGLLDFMKGKGYSLEDLNDAGLITIKESHQYDQFRKRVMFPIINLYGQTLGFGGRALGDIQPKYLNTQDTLIFNKRNHVYGINLLKKQRDLKYLVLVEGYMDVVALTQHGVQGVVATLGTALTAEQVRLMKRFSSNIHIAYDGDEPGQTAALRALALMHQEGIDASVLVFPDGQDPDDMIRSQGAEAFFALKPMPGMAFRLMRLERQYDLGLDDSRREFAKQACALVRSLHDPVEADHYLGNISMKTGIAKEVLAEQVRTKSRGLSKTSHDVRTANRSVSRMHRSMADAAESTLAALLASGYLPKGLVHESDFEDEHVRPVAEALLEGNSPAEILGGMEDESQRALASALFNRISDWEPDQAIQAADDCLHTIRISKLNKRIAQLAEDIKAQEGSQQTLSLHLIQELQMELVKLKQSWGGK
ncbi:MAG: DNA primase [Clostridiales bacterium]|nr:DNA primase [Clostridiales bacterium]